MGGMQNTFDEPNIQNTSVEVSHRQFDSFYKKPKKGNKATTSIPSLTVSVRGSNKEAHQATAPTDRLPASVLGSLEAENHLGIGGITIDSSTMDGANNNRAAEKSEKSPSPLRTVDTQRSIVESEPVSPTLSSKIKKHAYPPSQAGIYKLKQNIEAFQNHRQLTQFQKI